MQMTASNAGGATEAPLPAKKPPKAGSSYSHRVSVRIRELREERDWTVAEVTDRLNRILGSEAVAASTVHGWDNGSRKVDPDCYPALARVFGLSVRQFVPAK